MIAVKKINETSLEITVKSGTTTTHSVTLSPLLYKRLTNCTAPPELLIQKSFEFLLDREPITSILSSFDLQVISRYFPEYERTIRNVLQEKQGTTPDNRGKT